MESIQNWIAPEAQGSKYRRDIAFAHVEIDLRYGSDQHSEDDREKAKAWKFDEDRPQTVLLYVDPLMSAECALAILETVHWATDISYATPVRVIIVSNAPLPDSLKRLIRHYGHKSIRKFTFEVPEETMEERRAMYKVYVPF
ncbi:uncharacterized protein FFB20_05670 [Fusarium fujikuroi]|nr:uncharacterized protein FFB20_05670 [Fusarium fujikuroi]SCO18107.1 uncharacterized protein FFM5_11747 [Fusarium fujikuroi]